MSVTRTGTVRRGQGGRGQVKQRQGGHGQVGQGRITDGKSHIKRGQARQVPEQVRQKQRPFSLSGVKLTPRRLPPLISFSSGIVVMVVAASRGGGGGGSVPVGEELWLKLCTPLLVHTAVHTAVP